MSDSPMLRVRTTRTGDTAYLFLDGELDVATAPLVDDVLEQLLSGPEPTHRVVVEAEALTFVDVSGLAPLLRLARRMPAPGSVQLRNARRSVIRVIRLLQLDHAFGVDA